MSGDSSETVIYLVVLLIAIGGWMLVANRRQLGRMFQQAAVWGFIFLGAIAAVGLWSDVRDTVAPRASVIGNRIEIPQGRDGHYHLTLRLNDVPVDFIIDTGASDMVLSMTDAARIGIDPDALAFVGRATTANGTVRTATIRISAVEIGGVVEHNVPASVTEGEMSGSLLGIAYLQRFAKITIANGRMELER